VSRSRQNQDTPRSASAARKGNIRGNTRPTIFIPNEEATLDDPRLNTVDSRDLEERKLERQNELEERRKASFRKQEDKKQGKDKRPSSKQKFKKKKKEQRPPVSPGCFHICESLIFEVYKILGGNLCDCV